MIGKVYTNLLLHTQEKGSQGCWGSSPAQTQRPEVCSSRKPECELTKKQGERKLEQRSLERPAVPSSASVHPSPVNGGCSRAGTCFSQMTLVACEDKLQVVPNWKTEPNKGKNNGIKTHRWIQECRRRCSLSWDPSIAHGSAWRGKVQ